MKIKAPRGYRLLSAGTLRQVGDMHYMRYRQKKWHDVVVGLGRITKADISYYGAYIRRIYRPKKKGGKRK